MELIERNLKYSFINVFLEFKSMHGEKHVDSQGRKILLFKKKQKKNIFELGIGFFYISCHYLSLGSIFRPRKFSAYTVIGTDDLPT